jgi:hypothetical protein
LKPSLPSIGIVTLIWGSLLAAPSVHAREGNNQTQVEEAPDASLEQDAASSKKEGLPSADSAETEAANEVAEVEGNTSSPATGAAASQAGPVEKPEAADRPSSENQNSEEQSETWTGPSAPLPYLRMIERKVSLGKQVDDEEIKNLLYLARDDKDATVRAMAITVMTWFAPAQFFETALMSIDDADARVRNQSLLALGIWSRHLTPLQKKQIAAACVARLDDASDEVACSAARVMMTLDPPAGASEIAGRIETAGDARFGCWRALANLPYRDIRVAEPRVPEKAQDVSEEEAQEDGGNGIAPAEDMAVDTVSGPTGNGIFWSAAASAGLIFGGVLPGILSPPKDALIYTSTETTKIREEPSYLNNIGGGFAGALLFGGSAVLATYLVGPMDYAPATSVAAMSLVGATAGMGFGMALGLDSFWTSVNALALGTAGLAVGTVGAWIKPPSQRDVTLIASLSTMGTLAGALGSFTVLAVGTPVYFERVQRLDLAIGIGMLSGSAGGSLAWMSSPLLDISHGRIVASSAAAMAAAGFGIATTYLLVPVNIDIRTRIAAGVGLAGQMIAGGLAFVLLPDSWVGFVERRDIPVGREALVLEDGKLKWGIPGIQVFSKDYRPSAVDDPATLSIGISLVGGRF